MFEDTKFAVRLKQNEPMSAHTTLGVGGPADYYIEAKNSDEIVSLIKTADKNKIPFIVLGAASNLVVADKGFPGLIIQNRSSAWQILEQYSPSEGATTKTKHRWNELKKSPIDELAYDETKYPSVFVRVDSGASLSFLMIKLLEEGVTGLEWFAGIPATVGGGVYMNVHGGKHFLGDLIREARVLENGLVKTVPQSYFRFAYDWSILHDTKGVVLDVVVELKCGPVDKARKIIANWMKYKNITQPKRSSGCVFQNLSEADKIRLNLPTNSTGYFIDKVLKMTGATAGGAKISDEHGNFMINTGGAKADDFVELINKVKIRAKKEFNLELKEEIKYLGYSNQNF